MLLAGRNWLGWTLNINVIECYRIVLSLIAVPKDGGLQEGGPAAKTAMTHISVKGGFGLLQLLPQILRKQGDKWGKEEIET